VIARAALAVLLLAASAGAPAVARADAIDDYIRGEMALRRIPGLALAVVRDGAVVKLQAYGFANLEHEVPATPDTVFELASLTKQFTATAIMTLVEDGRLKLDDSVTLHVANSPEAWKPITVRHLLTHTSGLPGLAAGFASLEQLPERVRYSTADLFESASKDALGAPPGTRFVYSDVGYFLLRMIVEKASGRRWGDYLDTRFFKPLGMTSTSVLDHARILKHRAAGYTIRDGRLVNIRRIWDVELPSGYGVFSSVKDLVTWDAALEGGRVVKPATLAQMWTPLRRNDGGTGLYGFGWSVNARRGHRWISHSGLTGTEYSRFPDDRLTVIVLTNLGGFVDPASTADPWGLTYGVAGRYVPGLFVGTEPPRADPEPALTQRLRTTLERWARGEPTPGVTPGLRAAINRPLLARRLGTLQSFTFITCDDEQGRERWGDRVQRICHYRGVNAAGTRYYSFWLADDGRVVDFWSTTE
jgi:CubicO group peptidase (beta-lactamase class C family)